MKYREIETPYGTSWEPVLAKNDPILEPKVIPPELEAEYLEFKRFAREDGLSGVMIDIITEEALVAMGR